MDMTDIGHMNVALGGVAASVGSMASIEPMKVAERLGAGSAQFILGVACVTLVIALGFTIKLLVKLYWSNIEVQNDLAKAMQRLADKVDDSNKVAVEVKNAIQQCRR